MVIRVWVWSERSAAFISDYPDGLTLHHLTSHGTSKLQRLPDAIEFLQMIRDRGTKQNGLVVGKNGPVVKPCQCRSDPSPHTHKMPS
jgi:hypothetical protein